MFSKVSNSNLRLAVQGKPPVTLSAHISLTIEEVTKT